MKLYLDIGNSRIKWGGWEGGHWHAEGSVDSDAAEGVDWLAGLPQPERIFLAAVGHEARVAAIAKGCERIFGIVPERLRTATEACGVRCAYADPARLGVDRWLALVAAFQRSRDAAIVFDCGTAITVDAVAADGEHLGGLIVPGISLMRRALYGSTAGIPDEGEGDVGLLARDTRSAVSGGTLYAAVAFMTHVAAELRANLGPSRCFITGGDAERLLSLAGGEFEWQPRLVLEGMLAMTGELPCES